MKNYFIREMLVGQKLNEYHRFVALKDFPDTANDPRSLCPTASGGCQTSEAMTDRFYPVGMEAESGRARRLLGKV